ncbi:MAG TPA: signal peptidase I [Armatimonadota bacterium]|nr:signal peptidase I [Armatimonadota bacterium]
MSKKHSRLFREFVETIVMTLVVFLILVTFVIQGFKVYGSCMEPNLQTGERLLGNKFIYRFEKPNRGDIVVFNYPADPRKVFIKRIVALPGETVEIHRGKLFVDRKPVPEEYVKARAHGSYPPEKVAAGHVFVLGDNRDQSNDSRFWGELPIGNIQARAWLRYWPLSKISVFRSPPNAT